MNAAATLWRQERRRRYGLLALLLVPGITCGGQDRQLIPYKPGVRVTTLPAYVYDMRSDGVRLWIELQDGSLWSLEPGVTDAAQVVPPQQSGSASFPSPSLATGPQEVYFNGPGGNIWAVQKSGGTPRLLASGEQAPADLQTDGATLWWVALSSLRIRSVPVSGGTLSDVVAIGSRPYAAASDALFFWQGDLSSSFQLMRLDLAGGAATQIDGAINPYPMITSGGIVFYGKGSLLESRPTTGGAVTDIAMFDNDCRSRCAMPELLAVGANYLFVAATLTYVDGGDPNQIPVVFRVPVSGGTPELIATPSNVPTLAAASDLPYWSTGNDVFTAAP